MVEASVDDGGGTDPQGKGVSTWAQLRQRARSLLRSQSEQIRQVEGVLTEQVSALLKLVRAEHDQADRRVEELRAQVDTLEQSPNRSSKRRETDSLLEEARVALSQALREQQQLKTQLRIQEDEVHRYRTEMLDNGSANSAELVAERDQLKSQLDDAEERVANLEAGGGDSARFAEMRERFETAVSEIRTLKSENTELSAALAGGACETDDERNDSFDWESQKRRLLNQLESDFDSDDPEQAEGRLTVEGAIRITDQIVTRKEEEIAELKALLHDQSGKIGEVPVGATAVAALLDSDELVQAERESLKQLQDEWREKLRQAEVDISIERAKLAREKVVLEDQFESFQAGKTLGAEQDSKTGNETTKKSGGNWLTRLGLKDTEE